MIEVSAHVAGALASMVTLVWRLTTDTKRYEPEWWMFVVGHIVNVALQLIAGIERLLQ